MWRRVKIRYFLSKIVKIRAKGQKKMAASAMRADSTLSPTLEIVTVADFDSDKLVDHSLVHSWMLKFGHEITFLSRL